MTSLNNLLLDKHSSRGGPEVLIELPIPKLIGDECTIIINGNYGAEEDNTRRDEDTKTAFLHNKHQQQTTTNLHNKPSTHQKPSSKSASSNNSFPLKGSSVEASEPNLEPDRSTHLQRSQNHEAKNPKCLRKKPKLPSFKSNSDGANIFPLKESSIASSDSELDVEPESSTHLLPAAKATVSQSQENPKCLRSRPKITSFKSNSGGSRLFPLKEPSMASSEPESRETESSSILLQNHEASNVKCLTSKHELPSFQSNSGGPNTSSPLKESSSESEADVEPESSTRLLQSHEASNAKCLRTKPKLPSFKSSPAKRQIVHDAHSHIQHQPLGTPQSTLPSTSLFAKRNWTVPQFACLGFLMASILVGLVLVAIGLYYLSSAEDCGKTAQWWEKGTFYELFPASFQDSDGDGFGDVRGLISRLDYIQSLGVDAIRLNSVFAALDYPLEYDHVIDFANLDPHLGKMEDFQELVREVRMRGMHIVLDMNPTVTSDQHSWAAHWLLHRPGRYQHFYVNVTDQEEEPPLETAVDYREKDWPPPHRPFGGHLFLNWSNPLLQMEMRGVLELWLSMGVDGFYMKRVENIRLVDKRHLSTILQQWRFLLDKFSQNTTRKVLMMSQGSVEFLKSVTDPPRLSTLLGLVDIVDASVRISRNGSATGGEIEAVRNFWDQHPAAPSIVWHVGSVETLRLASRVGRGANMAAFLLLAILPGSMSCFYGDEIGLQDSFDPLSNKVYRGGQLTPMQWTSGYQANFTSDDTAAWLPVHPSYLTQNVDTAQEQISLLGTLVDLRRRNKLLPPQATPTLLHSLVTRLGGTTAANGPQYQWYHNPCGLVVAKIILLNSEYVYVGNFGSEGLSFSDEEEECAGGNFVFSLYPWKRVEVVISTNGALEGRVELSQLLLEPGDAVIGHLIT